MTTSTVRLMHCDHAGCDAQAPDDEKGYVADRPNGWKDAIYTHGCPEHGEAIMAHEASITSRSRGRGSRERTTWFLTCACGWQPPHFEMDSSRRLKEQHLKHVAAVTA